MMRIDKQKLSNAMSFILEINKADIRQMDFTDLFGHDLTQDEKDELYWGGERNTNMELIQRAILWYDLENK